MKSGLYLLQERGGTGRPFGGKSAHREKSLGKPRRSNVWLHRRHDTASAVYDRAKVMVTWLS